MQSLLQDVRYALRQLRKSPGFTVTAVLTLALGIGATTAIFSIFDAVVLKPLAYRDSGQLVVAWERVRFLSKDWPYVGPNPRHEDIWKREAKSFEDLALVNELTSGVSLGSDHPRLIGLIAVTPNLLSVLRVPPVLGRNFVQEEAISGHEHVAIISWNLWHSLFNGDPAVVGKFLKSTGAPTQVIGVLPRDFSFPRANELTDAPRAGVTPAVDIITPLVIKLDHYGWTGDFGNLVAIGRLKPGVTASAAEAELNTIAGDIIRQVPPGELDGDPKGALGAYVQPFKEAVVGGTDARLWLLLAAIMSVQLIACINLANAQLARAAARENEVAIRSALGASRRSLVQSMLVEVGILSAVGGALGIALAIELVRNFPSYATVALPRAGEIAINGEVLSMAALLTCGSMLLFGSLPGMRLLRLRPRNPMQAGGNRSVGAAGGKRLRKWLIGGQVCACTALLLTAGLFTKGLLKLTTQDMGFSTTDVVTATVDINSKEYTPERRIAFDDAVLERLRRLPGAESVGLVSEQPLKGDSWIDGIVPVDRKDVNVQGNYRWISPGYFDTLQQRIVEGRDLGPQDRSQKTAVISQATARAVWPGQDAIGRSFKRNGSTYTVVGIAADARTNSLRKPAADMVYLPYWDEVPYESFLMVRSSADSKAMVESIRKTIWDYDPGVTIASVNTMQSRASDSIAPERLESSLLAAFAGAALLLALLGIYGTLSYSIEARVREIGLRMALGATRPSVYLLTLKEVLVPVGIGLCAGWLFSIVAGRSLSAMLYDTRPSDPMVAAAVLCIFAVAAAAATFLPCRRAAAVEPMQALRAE